MSDPIFHESSFFVNPNFKDSCQTLSIALNIASASARVHPNLLKAIETLLDKTFRRSAVD